MNEMNDYLSILEISQKYTFSNKSIGNVRK